MEEPMLGPVVVDVSSTNFAVLRTGIRIISCRTFLGRTFCLGLLDCCVNQSRRKKSGKISVLAMGVEAFATIFREITKLAHLRLILGGLAR